MEICNTMMTARIRKDLLKQGMAVPVGQSYYNSPKPLWAKWVKDTFMVYYHNEWVEAESIDWEYWDFDEK
jgi:hypothetical protein